MQAYGKGTTAKRRVRGEKKSRKLKKKKKEALPVSQSMPQTLIPCAPFVVLREKERVYLRSKSIHNENPPARSLYRSPECLTHTRTDSHVYTRRAHTHVNARHPRKRNAPSSGFHRPDASLSLPLFFVLSLLSPRRARQ